MSCSGFLSVSSHPAQFKARLLGKICGLRTVAASSAFLGKLISGESDLYSYFLSTRNYKSILLRYFRMGS